MTRGDVVGEHVRQGHAGRLLAEQPAAEAATELVVSVVVLDAQASVPVMIRFDVVSSS